MADSVVARRLLRELKALRQRYDGENDIIPGAPVVTFSDCVLIDAVMDLVLEVVDLQGRVNKLTKDLANEDRSGG
jgi:hypothetical protein